MPVNECPKCRAAFEEGFLLSRASESYSLLHDVGKVVWATGSINLGILGGQKLKGSKRKIEALRCTGCGYIEFYAKLEIAKRN